LRADVEQHADVRMIEAGDRPGLALEARPQLRVARELRRQHLDGYVSRKPRVAGAVNLSHPARANGRSNLIRAEPGTGREGHDLTESLQRSKFVRHHCGEMIDVQMCGIPQLST